MSAMNVKVMVMALSTGIMRKEGKHSGIKLLCGDPVRDALQGIGRRTLTRQPTPWDFTEEERFRMFRRVMHGQVWPAADMVDYSGRVALSWSYSAHAWRHGGRRKFMAEVEKAARQELADADYTVFDLSPLHCLIGNDGPRYCRILRAADVAEMEQRMSGMKADLMVLDRKLDQFGRNLAAFCELRYRIDLYDNSYEAVISGGKGGWPWAMLMP